MTSPTRKRKSQPRKKRPRPARRPKQPTPEIYVKTQRPELGWWYHRAHLRNKAGYVYLCWREGQRVRTLYIGKAPRKSPTAGPRDRDGRTTSTSSPRRARKEQNP